MPPQGCKGPSRRELATGALALSAAAAAAGCDRQDPPSRAMPEFSPGSGVWGQLRRQFALSRDRIHMSAMLIASHPAPVREAIERHRRALDADPVVYLESNNTRLTRETLSAAGRYMNVAPEQVALTDSTTMGVGLVYASLALRPGQEILTTEHDYFVTHESIRLACLRTGATQRRIPLFEDVRQAAAGEIAGRLIGAVTPATRVIGLTWVHSSTGLKLPLKGIAEAIEPLNARRDPEDQILIVVDGVHGFGIEDAGLPELGCDFLAAGCHKWLFGPRGTGIVAGSRRGYEALTPGIPSFLDEGVWAAWLGGGEAPERVDGRTLTPGGFKDFEHRWALAQAFELHQAIGRRRVAERTWALAGQLKEGLAGMRGVTLVTPRTPDLSAGIVSFDVEGMDPQAAVRALRGRGVVASVAPYATRHVRLTPSIRNTPAEVDAALKAIAEVAA